MSDGRPELADVLTELAAATAEPFDVAEVMHLASDRACQVLSCEAAMILLSIDGASLGTAAATAGLPMVGDLLAGTVPTPCHDALTTGASVTFADDAVPEHYLDFAAIAAGMGIRGALAVPLRHRESVIGTLCVMRTHRRHFPAHTIEDAQRLADVVAAAIVRENAHRAALAVGEQLQHALNARVVIEQAKGMVAADRNISVDEAFELIRRFARRHQVRLAEVAAEIVKRELSSLLLQ